MLQQSKHLWCTQEQVSNASMAPFPGHGMLQNSVDETAACTSAFLLVAHEVFSIEALAKKQQVQIEFSGHVQ